VCGGFATPLVFFRRSNAVIGMPTQVNFVSGVGYVLVSFGNGQSVIDSSHDFFSFIMNERGLFVRFFVLSDCAMFIRYKS